MAEVSLARIDLSFGRGPNAVAALRDVSFDVPAGSRLAILGPSGCGKTTLLRVIAGLERPSRGTLRFDGVDIDAIRPERRRVGFVFASDDGGNKRRKMPPKLPRGPRRGPHGGGAARPLPDCPPGGRTRVVRPAPQPVVARAGSRGDTDGNRPRRYDA